MGESYDAFDAANGVQCEGADGTGNCMLYDFCRAEGRCEVALETDKAYCALLGAGYSAYADANGVLCGDEGGRCSTGDRCAGEGLCEVVGSAVVGPPHVELFGKHYDAFRSPTGPRCGAEACMFGDRCIAPNVCELVLAGVAGTLHAELVGTTYPARQIGGGGHCGVGEFAGDCLAGDRCVTSGTCEVLFSAWSF